MAVVSAKTARIQPPGWYTPLEQADWRQVNKNKVSAMAPPASPPPTQHNRSALEQRMTAMPANLDDTGVPLAGGLPRSSLSSDLGSSQGWQQIECKEEPVETAKAVQGKPAPPVPPTGQKRGPPDPRGSAFYELQAQGIDDRNAFGSAALRMSNIAKIQAVERQKSGCDAG